MEMDWKPTTPTRYPIYDSYRDSYRMPGAWPESPPDRSISFLSQKRKRDEDEQASLAVKRVCKTALACGNNAVEYISSYKIIQALRQRLSRTVKKKNRNAVSQVLSVSQNNTACPPVEDRARAIASYQRPTEPVPYFHKISNISRTDKINRRYLTLDGSPSDTNFVRKRLPLNRSPPVNTIKSQAEFLYNFIKETPRSSVPAPPAPVQMSNPIAKKRGRWASFASVSTKQHPLPTPEPEIEPSPKLEVTPKVEESSLTALRDIFSNVPDLRPSISYRPITPEMEREPIPSIEEPEIFPGISESHKLHPEEMSSLLTNKTCHSEEVRSDTAESMHEDDSPSAQLRENLYATLGDLETEPDTSSEQLDPAWIKPKVTFAPDVIVIPAEDATDSLNVPNDSNIKSPKFTPPSFRDRSPSSLLSTPSETVVVISDMESGGSDKQVSSLEVTGTLVTPTKVEREYPSTPVVGVAIKPDSATNIAPEEQIAKLTIQDESPSKVATPKAGFHAMEKLRRLTRQRALKEQALQEALNEYEIVPLTEEWDKKVRNAVKQGSGKYSASDLARVVPQYASRGQDNWLNDEAINGYLDLIVAHGKKNDRETQTPSHHAFNSFFYSNLSQKGTQSVARWARRAKIAGKELLNVEKIFIPVNAGAHWTLAVVEATNRRIIHYNSLQSASRGATVCDNIKKWLAMELGPAFKDEEWTVETTGKSPQQTNSDDCGVFTITSARQIMLGFDPTSYQSNQIQTQRKRIVAELVAGALIKSKE